MRVLLLNLDHPGVRPQDRQEHLGLGYLAAVLRLDGHEVGILDASASRMAPAAVLHEAMKPPRPDLIGVSIPFQERLSPTLTFISDLRRRGFQGRIMAGGHPPTFLYESILGSSDGLDLLVLGEGEETVRDLAAHMEAGSPWYDVPGIACRLGDKITANPSRPLIKDLDSLPFPARDTLDVYLCNRGPTEVKTASVLRSRGCTANCSFCDTRAFYGSMPGKPWRVRSATDVVEEMALLSSTYGVEFVRFWDDNFMGPGQRGLEEVNAFAEELLSRGLNMGFALECRVDSLEEETMRLLQKAGLKRVFLGIESGVQRGLDTYNKKVTVEDNRRALALLKRLGIDVTVGFIMFDPYTTLSDVVSNLDFLHDTLGPWSEVKRVVAQPMNALQVYDGTAIFRELGERGLLLNEDESHPAYYRYRFLDWRVGVLFKVITFVRRIGLPIRDALVSLLWRSKRLPVKHVPEVSGE